MRRHNRLNSNAAAATWAVLMLIGLYSALPAAAQAPPNDDFDGAVAVGSIPFTHNVSTVEATPAYDDPYYCYGGPTVWYAFTPTADVRVDVNTFGSDYDTGLSAYTGSRGSLNVFACSDDAGGTTQSRLIFNAVAGETYYFMVGSYGFGPGGNLTFTVQEAPPPLTIDLTINPTGSVDRIGDVTVSGTVACSRFAHAYVYGEVKQVVGRTSVIYGSFSAGFTCDGVTSWQATAVAQGGKFAGGSAKVSAYASGYDPEFGDGASDQGSAIISLRSGRPKSAAATSGPDAPGTADLPGTLGLRDNYPNPFNPATEIDFELPEAAEVRLAVYDLAGREVAVLTEGPLEAGAHRVAFEAGGLPSGTYMYRLVTPGGTLSRKMVLLR